MAQIKRGNSLLIYKTEKGYFFNRETGKRMKAVAYDMQFLEGRRVRRQALEKGLERLQTAKTKKQVKEAQRFTEQLSESLRIKATELKELRSQRLISEYIPYWELAKDNKNFKKGKVTIKTPSGGTIKSSADNLNALDAFQDLTNLLNKSIEEHKKAGNDSVLISVKREIFFNEETGEEEILIDFSNLQEFQAQQATSPDPENFSPVDDSIYASFYAGWLDRQKSL